MIVVVAEVLMGALLPASVSIGPVSPASIAIVVTWLAGVDVVEPRAEEAWLEGRGAPREAGPAAPARRRIRRSLQRPAGSIRRSIVVFVVAAAVTLVAGVLLEVTGATAGRAART